MPRVPRKQRVNVQVTSFGVLALIYIVGAYGLFLNSKGLFVKLVPAAIVLTAAGLFINHIGEKPKVLLHFIAIYAITMGIEWLAISTGVLFGSYQYQFMMGPKIYGVPFIVGVSWWMMVYMGFHMVKKLKMNRIKKTAVATVVITFLLVLGELTAQKLGLWIWDEKTAPLQNFFVHAAVYFILIYSSKLIKFKRKNYFIFPTILILTLFFLTISLAM